MLSVPSRSKLLVKPTLSVGSAANVENVTTPYVIREFVADTPGMAAIATGRTMVSLPNTAASVSPRRSSIASTSSTSSVLGSTSTETKTSVSGNRSFRRTASAVPSPFESMKISYSFEDAGVRHGPCVVIGEVRQPVASAGWR